VQVLGDTPTGRLHREIVQKGLASAAWGAERGLHDPGYVYFGAALARDANLEPAREALVRVVESLAASPVTAEEVERARTRLLNEFQKAELDTGSMVRALSEFQAIGDWRLLFLYRDRLRRVTLQDVQRVAGQYLKPANRVLGVFVPTDSPERADIPPTPDLQDALAGYRGGESVHLGEAFDPSPRNIESRLVRRTLSNGIRVALLPKKTRGSRVVASLTLHWGDEQSLTNREVACDFAGSMLMRGTRQKSRAALVDAFERLNASASIGEQGASLEVRRENLVAALRLVAEVLREPAFPAAEFEEMKRAALTGAQSQLSDPSALASVRLARHLHAYPEGHPHYTPTIEERIEKMRGTTLEDARACYRDLIGATQADFVAVGDFDADEVARAVDELFGAWRTPRPFQRVPWRHFERPPLANEFVTPDKANAVLRAGLNVKMRDDHPDFPALVLANHLLGGSPTARVPARVREKEGLSYSTYTSFTSSAFDESAEFRVSAIFAPQNRGAVERAIREEIARAVREGFAPAELEAGKHSVLQARRLARTQDRTLASRLSSYSFARRTFAWDVALEKKIASLSAAEVNAALKKYIDPQRLAIILAGDFKKD
jgi:zinc protease